VQLIRPFPIQSLADISAAVLREGEDSFSVASKTFVDAICHPENADPSVQAAMIEQEPAITGRPRIDIHLAAAAEDIALRNGLEIPAWALKSTRFAAQPILFGSSPMLQEINLVQTPSAWRRRNLFCGPVVLQTHRWRQHGQ
jgi:hypothetical protein